jgi:hypothetical protein
MCNAYEQHVHWVEYSQMQDLELRQALARATIGIQQRGVG